MAWLRPLAALSLVQLLLLLSRPAAALPLRRVSGHQGLDRHTVGMRDDGRRAAAEDGRLDVLDPGSSYTEGQVARLSPVTLAFVGDAVFELHARTANLWPPMKPERQRKLAVDLVRAEAQSMLLRRLVGRSNELAAASEGWVLTEHELELLRTGRNKAGRAPARLAEANAANVYGEATALETLVGFLYLTDRPRLQALFRHLDDLSLPGESRWDDAPPTWSEEEADVDEGA